MRRAGQGLRLLWGWLRDEQNRGALGLVGTGLAAITAAAWALFLYLQQPPSDSIAPKSNQSAATSTSSLLTHEDSAVGIPNAITGSHSSRPQEVRPDAHRGDVRSSQATSPEAPIATRQAIAASAFEGEWHSRRFGYGFEIVGDRGVATASNSRHFKAGDTILIIEEMRPNGFSGRQMFQSGRWNAVDASLHDPDLLEIRGAGWTWTMKRR